MTAKTPILLISPVCGNLLELEEFVSLFVLSTGLFSGITIRSITSIVIVLVDEAPCLSVTL